MIENSKQHSAEEIPQTKRKLTTNLSFAIVFIIGLLITIISFTEATNQNSLALYSGIFIIIVSCLFISNEKTHQHKEKLNIDPNNNKEMEL